MQKGILIFCLFVFLIGCSDDGEVNLLKPQLFGEKTIGSLQIDSQPTGAKIYLGMKWTGRTTPAIFENLSAGYYAIDLFLENYQCWSDVVKVKSNDLEIVQANLTSGNSLSVTITSVKRVTTSDGYPAIEWKYKFDHRNYLSNMKIEGPKEGYWLISVGQVDGNVEYSSGACWDYSRPPSGTYTLNFTGSVPDSDGISYSLTTTKYVY